MVSINREDHKHNHRYYNADPATITVEQCAQHGGSHKAYGWNPQPDLRWSDEKFAAYINAYNGETINEEVLDPKYGK